jgi:hypothetical protein
MSANSEALIAQWVEEARDLGVQHASGQGSDDRPEDAIDLNAYGSISYGEIAEIQNALRAAYEEGQAATCTLCGHVHAHEWTLCEHCGADSAR